MYRDGVMVGRQFEVGARILVAMYRVGIFCKNENATGSQNVTLFFTFWPLLSITQKVGSFFTQGWI